MRRAWNLALVGGTLTVLVCWSLELAEASVQSLFPRLGQRAVELEQLREEVDAFAERLTVALDDLARGRTSLRAASRALEEYTVEHYPMYFTNLTQMDPDMPMRVKIARMLLRQFDDPPGDVVTPPIDDTQRANLAREYQEITAETATTP